MLPLGSINGTAPYRSSSKTRTTQNAGTFDTTWCHLIKSMDGRLVVVGHEHRQRYSSRGKKKKDTRHHRNRSIISSIISIIIIPDRNGREKKTDIVKEVLEKDRNGN